MFTFDGITWNYPCTIEATAEISSTEISGLLLNKVYFNDVRGTYMSYSVTIAVPMNKVHEFNALYDALNEAVGYHTATFPYESDTVTISGRVESVTKTFVRMPGDKNYWKGISFQIIACTPTKTQSLGEAISYGLPPWPQTVELPVGSVWEYTATGWQAYDAPPDADDIYY